MKILCMLISISLSGFLFGQKVNTNDLDALALLQKTVKAHGGNKYKKAHYQFTFRENIHRFKNSKHGYDYSVRKSKNGQQIFDQLIDGEFTRSINGQIISLSPKEKQGGANSLNSVIYFATLPHKLQDPAVQVMLGESIKIKGVNYKVLHVSFAVKGGGDDHDDEYVYWIRDDNYEIDYFAYNYQVNGGGVRFRSAYNKRKVKGILFQDYINYKVDVGTDLRDIPLLFEKGELKKLSVIETEQISKI